MSGALIAVVGVCASGKSLLVHNLRERGFNARQVSQEHSYVRDMWLRLTRPDMLIYLDVSLETIRRRRRDPEWPAGLLQAQQERLQNARECCDLHISADHLQPEEVLMRVLDMLRVRGIEPGWGCES